MGEYAVRKSDNEKIKIGTCNLMYYLRYEQREEVVPSYPLSLNELWFRLSLRGEDGILPGDFEYYGHGGSHPLPFVVKTDDKGNVPKEAEEFYNELAELSVSEKGIVQVRSEEVGIMCNIPCFHGYHGELPEGMFYSSPKRNLLSVFSVGVRDEAKALIGCTVCGNVICSVNVKELRYCVPKFDKDAENWERLIAQMEAINRELGIKK